MARTVSSANVIRNPVSPEPSTQAIIAVATKQKWNPRRRLIDAALYLAIPIVAISLWWFLSADSTSPFFPPLSRILEKFQENWLFEGVVPHVLPSLGRMLAGYAIAIVVGVAVGVVCGRVKPIYQALSPFVHLGRAIPAAALLPVAMTIFGIGDLMKVMLIAFVCMFPVLLNTIDAVGSVDRGLEDTSRIFQFTAWQRLTRILLPFAAPRIFAGARIALSIALIMMIISEMLAATNGIGYATLLAQQKFQLSDMWAGMILLGVIGIILSAVFVVVQRLVIRWNPNLNAMEP